MLSKIDISNIQESNYAYIGRGEILKFVNAKENILIKDGRNEITFVDISSYGLRDLYASPVMSEDEESLTIQRIDGELKCKEGTHYLKKYPVLIEIYELAEKAKASKK